MENLILSLADRVLQGGAITCQEAEQLIDVSDDDTMLLLAMADRIRQKFTGDAVGLLCYHKWPQRPLPLKIVNFVLSQPIIILVLKNIHC